MFKLGDEVRYKELRSRYIVVKIRIDIRGKQVLKIQSIKTGNTYAGTTQNLIKINMTIKDIITERLLNDSTTNNKINK